MKISGHNKGFTLIEMVLALAILGSIGGVMAMTISQTIFGSRRSNDQATVLSQVQTAGYWMARDAQMSQYDLLVADDDPDSPEVAHFEWSDWAASELLLCEIDYTLVDNKLIRTLYEDGIVVNEITVARNIDQVSCTYYINVSGYHDEKKLTISITASSGEASLTREYKARPRSTGLENWWE
jgi:prepilin-type N-terminal cleavage/methylation domain-containing protein